LVRVSFDALPLLTIGRRNRVASTCAACHLAAVVAVIIDRSTLGSFPSRRRKTTRALATSALHTLGIAEDTKALAALPDADFVEQTGCSWRKGAFSTPLMITAEAFFSRVDRRPSCHALWQHDPAHLRTPTPTRRLPDALHLQKRWTSMPAHLRAYDDAR
jgi:hypothetical protein